MRLGWTMSISQINQIDGGIYRRDERWQKKEEDTRPRTTSAHLRVSRIKWCVFSSLRGNMQDVKDTCEYHVVVGHVPVMAVRLTSTRIFRLVFLNCKSNVRTTAREFTLPTSKLCWKLHISVRWLLMMRLDRRFVWAGKQHCDWTTSCKIASFARIFYRTRTARYPGWDTAATEH